MHAHHEVHMHTVADSVMHTCTGTGSEFSESKSKYSCGWGWGCCIRGGGQRFVNVVFEALRLATVCTAIVIWHARVKCPPLEMDHGSGINRGDNDK